MRKLSNNVGFPQFVSGFHIIGHNGKSMAFIGACQLLFGKIPIVGRLWLGWAYSGYGAKPH
jgi:hypothetical protein